MKWYAPDEKAVEEVDKLGKALTCMLQALTPSDAVALYTVLRLIENVAGTIVDNYPELKQDMITYIADQTDGLMEEIRSNRGVKKEEATITPPEEKEDDNKDKDQVSQRGNGPDQT